MVKSKQIFQVDGKPFFPLGAQCGTNNTYYPGGLDQFWRLAEAMRLNTAELQVFWELLEPVEGQYDFTQVDRLIQECRAHGVKMVLIWFATWRNGEMKYAPDWVKQDRQRFRRVVNEAGVEQLVLSSHCQATYEADVRALLRLVQHVKDVDGEQHTVIALQLENESGIFGAARDHGPEAEADFRRPVPQDLLAAISGCPGPPVYAAWQANGAKPSGSWPEVFGRDADEFMTAWSIASYINREAAAVRRVVDLPLYVNVWMQEAGFEYPGLDYPSGGPVYKVLDIWKWATPDIDAICPDNYSTYFSQFRRYCAQYQRPDNPLFIPEATSQTALNWTPFVAIGEFDCVGYGCMGHVYNIVDEAGNIPEGRVGIVQSFRDLSDITPLLADYYGTGRIHALVQEPGMEERLVKIDGWDILVHFVQSLKGKEVPPRKPAGAMGAGLLVQTARNEFYVVGNDFSLEIHRAQPADARWPGHAAAIRPQAVDYLLTEEGYFDETGWRAFNRRNGDSNDNGVVLMPQTRVMHVVMDE